MRLVREKKPKEIELNYTQILLDRTNKNRNFDPKAVIKAYAINKKRSFLDVKDIKNKTMTPKIADDVKTKALKILEKNFKGEQ